MSLDIKAFNTAVFANSGKGFVQLAKDGKGVETVGTGSLGNLRVKFLSADPRHRATREALFTAVSDSLKGSPRGETLRNFLSEIAEKLGVKLDKNGAIATGKDAKLSSDKPLARRTVREVLNYLAGVRNSGEFDPAWMKAVRRHTGTYAWTRKQLDLKLRQPGWSGNDEVRKMVVDAIRAENKEIMTRGLPPSASGDEKPSTDDKKPSTGEKKPETLEKPSSQPKSEPAPEPEILPTGTTDLQPVKLLLDGGDDGIRGTSQSIESELKGIVKSVKDNPAGGHCFFYAVLDQMNCQHPMSICNAFEMREKLVEHGASLAEKAQLGKLDKQGLRCDRDGLWTVPTSAGRVNVNLAMDQQAITEFKTGNDWAEFQQAAFVADMLKRPVTVISTAIRNDTHRITFDRDLTNGKVYPGEEIVLYFTADDKHFRAAELA